MRLLTLNICCIITVASAATLRKRCSPIVDAEYQNGYLPPVPCWLEPDPACQPFIPEGTELFVDKESNSVILTGVSEGCVETIAEEHRRELDGRKTYGWTENIGKLNTSREGVLVITEMSDETIERYEQLVKGPVN